MKKRKRKGPAGRERTSRTERAIDTAAYAHAREIDGAFIAALPLWIRILVKSRRVPHKVKRFLGQHLSGVEIVINPDRTEIWKRGKLFHTIKQPNFG